MNDGYAWWLVIVGIAIGIALAWLVAGRLPRREDDVDEDERIAEADWISQALASSGTNAPVPLVEQVLDLHARYLASGTALTPPSTDVSEPLDSPDRSFTPSPPG
jgi:hypothetical protein